MFKAILRWSANHCYDWRFQPSQDWFEFCCYSSGDSVSKLFLDFVITNSSIQFVNFPTRGNNIRDLILANDEQVVNCVSSNVPIGHSDHCVVDFAVVSKRTNLPSANPADGASRYNWYASDFEPMSYHFDCVDWDSYRQDLPEGQLCRYFVYSRAAFGFFAPQGRHVAPIKVKLAAPPCQIWPWSVQGWGFTAPKTEKKSNFTNIIAPRGGSLAQFLQNLQGICASSVSITFLNLAALCR